MADVYANAKVLSRGEYARLLKLCPEVEGRVQASHKARFARRPVAALA